MSNIIIVGAGLTGSILAIKIAEKYKNKNIYLIDSSNKILSSFKPINLKGTEVNNGFHGLEINRSKKFFFFLKNKIGIKFKKYLIKRLLLINNFFIKNTNYKNFPIELKKDLKRKKFKSNSLNKIYSLIKGNYKKTIETVSKRYFIETKKSLKHFIPWFLPNEFHYNSKDEGDLYRIKSKKRKNNYIAVPKNDLFYEVSLKFKKKIKAYKNIHFLKNTSLDIKNKNVYLTNEKNEYKIIANKIFITSMPTFFFKFFTSNEKKSIKKLVKNKKYFILCIVELKKNLKTYFSEIICASKYLIELTRISKVNISNKKNILLLELLFNNKDLNHKLFRKKILETIQPIIKKNEIIKINKVVSRNIYLPSDKDIDSCSQIIDKKVRYFKKNGIDISFNPYFAPINMSKAWILSNKFYDEADKILSR